MTGAPTDASPECGHPANELLDFHVNGSLEGEEAAMVAAHVMECIACSRDVRELRSLSAAIEEHGTVADPAWRKPSLLWGWLGTAAAVAVVGVLVFRLVRTDSVQTRVASAPPSEGGVAPPSPAAPAAVEQTLDLGAGTMRDGGAPLRLDLEPGVSSVRLTLRAPVVPGSELRIGVRGPADEKIVADDALPPRDAMGRVAIAVPASRFAVRGTYRVVLTPSGPDASAGPFSYPFEVRLAAGPG